MSEKLSYENEHQKEEQGPRIPGGKFMGVEMSEKAKLRVSAVGIVVAAMFHFLPYALFKYGNPSIMYIFSMIYSVSLMSMFILMVTERSYIVEQQKTLKFKSLALSSGVIAIIMIISMALSIGVGFMPYLHTILIFILFYTYYSICPLISSVLDTPLSGLMKSKQPEPKMQQHQKQSYLQPI